MVKIYSEHKTRVERLELLMILQKEVSTAHEMVKFVNLHPKVHHQPPVFAPNIAPRVTLFPADDKAGVHKE
jgi:hypothetical protein